MAKLENLTEALELAKKANEYKQKLLFCGRVGGIIVTFFYQDGYRRLWQGQSFPWPNWGDPVDIIPHKRLCVKN